MTTTNPRVCRCLCCSRCPRSLPSQVRQNTLNPGQSHKEKGLIFSFLFGSYSTKVWTRCMNRLGSVIGSEWRDVHEQACFLGSACTTQVLHNVSADKDRTCWYLLDFISSSRPTPEGKKKLHDLQTDNHYCGSNGSRRPISLTRTRTQ